MALFLEKLIKGIPTAPKAGTWYKIGYATQGQEETLRAFAREQGFKNLRGFNKFMESMNWDYYDVIKVSCRD